MASFQETRVAPPGEQVFGVNESVAVWLQRFSRLLAGEDDGRGLFAHDSHWRDAISFTWDIKTVSGENQIVDQLTRLRSNVQAVNFTPSQEPPAQIKQRGGIAVIEAFFDFWTRHGSGRGIVRLLLDQEGRPSRRPQAWTLLTMLQELRGAEPRTGQRRPRGTQYAGSFGAKNWRDRREEARKFEDREPEVLIVGGGQAGLILAARLSQMGVDALIIDRNTRIGDNWRKRYRALALHNEAWVNDLPYMPFPPTWPVYLPKDMIADWFETYAWALELNFWTSTELLEAKFDEFAHRWTVKVRNAEFGSRVLSPRHLVIATGLSGGPKIPELPGLADFEGVETHTSGYTDGSAWKGKRAVVVGTGNSAHDTAQDLHSYGADVTMVQRGSTTVTSVEPAAQLVFALYSEGPATEDCDLLSVSMPYPLLEGGQKILTEKMSELDRDLIAGLEKVGFRTDQGHDDTGYYMKYLRTGGGYYLNVGCSELIAAGKIKLLRNENVERYVRDGLKLADGSIIPADLIVLATGYENMQEGLRRLLGDGVAVRVGPVWGFDDNGDVRNVWKQTAQENLWLMAGSFAQCRTYSRYVALQIKAIEEGIITHRAAASAHSTSSRSA